MANVEDYLTNQGLTEKKDQQEVIALMGYKIKDLSKDFDTVFQDDPSAPEGKKTRQDKTQALWEAIKQVQGSRGERKIMESAVVSVTADLGSVKAVIDASSPPSSPKELRNAYQILEELSKEVKSSKDPAMAEKRKDVQEKMGELRKKVSERVSVVFSSNSIDTDVKEINSKIDGIIKKSGIKTQKGFENKLAEARNKLNDIDGKIQNIRDGTVGLDFTGESIESRIQALQAQRDRLNQRIEEGSKVVETRRDDLNSFEASKQRYEEAKTRLTALIGNDPAKPNPLTEAQQAEARKYLEIMREQNLQMSQIEGRWMDATDMSTADVVEKDLDLSEANELASRVEKLSQAERDGIKSLDIDNLGDDQIKKIADHLADNEVSEAGMKYLEQLIFAEAGKLDRDARVVAGTKMMKSGIPERFVQIVLGKHASEAPEIFEKVYAPVIKSYVESGQSLNTNFADLHNIAKGRDPLRINPNEPYVEKYAKDMFNSMEGSRKISAQLPAIVEQAVAKVVSEKREKGKSALTTLKSTIKSLYDVAFPNQYDTDVKNNPDYQNMLVKIANEIDYIDDLKRLGEKRENIARAELRHEEVTRIFGWLQTISGVTGWALGGMGAWNLIGGALLANTTPYGLGLSRADASGVGSIIAGLGLSGASKLLERVNETRKKKREVGARVEKAELNLEEVGVKNRKETRDAVAKAVQLARSLAEQVGRQSDPTGTLKGLNGATMPNFATL